MLSYKYTKASVTFLLFCLLFTACKDEDRLRVIEGFLYENCGKEPVVGLQLSIFGKYPRTFGAGGFIYFGEITTDKNGYYSLVYKPDEDKETLNEYSAVEYITQAGETVMSIGYNDHIKAVHYRDMRVQHKVILRLDDTLNNQDTIYLNVKADGERIFFVGPFQDGQTFSIQAPYQQFERNVEEFNRLSKYDKAVFYWGLGWQEFLDVKNQTAYPEYVNYIRGIKQEACGQGGDIMIDLREE